MMHEIESVLDRCIERMLAGESMDTCLDDYPEFAKELRPLLSLAEEMLHLESVEVSDEAVVAGKQRMLQALAQKRKRETHTQTSGIFQPFITAMQTITNSISNKEKLMFKKPFLVILLVIALVFGGSGITALAAQSALPGDALYPIKTALEDTQYRLTWDNKGEAEVSLRLADRRVSEVMSLIEAGRFEDVPSSVQRYEFHIQTSLDALNSIAQSDPAQAQILAKTLSALLLEQMQMLSSLEQTSQDQVKPMLEQAVQVSKTSLELFSSVAGEDLSIANSNDNTGVDNSNDNTGNENGNDNGNDNTGDDNSNDNTGNENGNDNTGNENGNDNSNDNSGNDNGNDNSGDDNGNDNTGDDNSNDNSGDDNSNDNSGDDNDDENALLRLPTTQLLSM